MNVTVCREMLENTLAENMKGSETLAEILYEPSFLVSGRTVYCQLRRKGEEYLVFYEHFSRYEFFLLEERQCLYSITPDVFTDCFCGMVILPKTANDELNQLLAVIHTFENQDIETSMGLDGFCHTVIVNGLSFFWWNSPICKEATILDQFVSSVFRFLPETFRRTT